MFRSQKKNVKKILEKKEIDPEKIATLKFLGELEEVDSRNDGKNNN